LRQKRFLIFCMAVLGSFSLISGSKPEQKIESIAEPLKELNVIFGNLDVNYNPQQAYTYGEGQLFTALYEGLTSFDQKSLRPVPGIAESWTWEDDKKTIIFKIRDSACFSDGTDITAAIIRNSWLKLIDPLNNVNFASLLDVIENAGEYRSGVLKDPDSVGIKILGEKTLKVFLAHEAPHFLSILSHYSTVPLPENEDFFSYWDEGKNKTISGPFIIEKQSDDELILKKNTSYWDRENVKLDRIILKKSNGAISNTKQFNLGKTDWVSSMFHVQDVNNSGAILVNPMFATTYFFLRADRAPWSDERIRKALFLLLPLDEIRDNQLIPGNTLVPVIPYYPEIKGIYKQNRKEALKLLNEAGYPSGKGLPDINIMIPEMDDEENATIIMKQVWEKELALTVHITMKPFSQYVDDLDNKIFEISSISWIGDYADPLTFLSMWTSGSSLNDPGYSNEEYDRLIRESMSQDLENRYKLLAEAENLLLDSGVLLPIGHSPAVNLVDQRFITGWYENVLDIHPFKGLDIRVGYPVKNSL